MGLEDCIPDHLDSATLLEEVSLGMGQRKINNKHPKIMTGEDTWRDSQMHEKFW